MLQIGMSPLMHSYLSQLINEVVSWAISAISTALVFTIIDSAGLLPLLPPSPATTRSLHFLDPF